MSNLCIDCGLCCDGLFGRVVIEEGDDVPALKAANLVFTTEGGETSFSLPCPAFRGGCCSIYDVRPAVCRRFECELLATVERGELSEGKARSLIRAGTELRDRLRRDLEALVGERGKTIGALAATLAERAAAEPDPVAARLRVAHVTADFVALRTLLERHFERPDQAVEPASAVEGPSGSHADRAALDAGAAAG